MGRILCGSGQNRADLNYLDMDGRRLYHGRFDFYQNVLLRGTLAVRNPDIPGVHTPRVQEY